MTHDDELDEIFGSVAPVVAENLLPPALRKRLEEAGVASATVRGAAREIIKTSSVTLSRPHYSEQMRHWISKGETVESFVAGCDPSIRDAVRKIATEEGLL